MPGRAESGPGQGEMGQAGTAPPQCGANSRGVREGRQHKRLAATCPGGQRLPMVGKEVGQVGTAPPQHGENTRGARQRRYHERLAAAPAGRRRPPVAGRGMRRRGSVRGLQQQGGERQQHIHRQSKQRGQCWSCAQAQRRCENGRQRSGHRRPQGRRARLRPQSPAPLFRGMRHFRQAKGQGVIALR